MQPGQSTGCPLSFSFSFLLPLIPFFPLVPFSVSVSHSRSFFSLLRLLQWHGLPCSDLINHIQTALCCFLSFYLSPSPFSYSNCLLFSLPVSRRKRFSLSNNKRQILIQCIHFTTDGFYTCRLNLARRYAVVCIHANVAKSQKTQRVNHRCP